MHVLYMLKYPYILSFYVCVCMCVCMGMYYKKPSGAKKTHLGTTFMSF